MRRVGHAIAHPFLHEHGLGRGEEVGGVIGLPDVSHPLVGSEDVDIEVVDGVGRDADELIIPAPHGAEELAVESG